MLKTLRLGLLPVKVYWLNCQVIVPLVARAAQEVEAFCRYVPGGGEVDHAALAGAAVREADAGEACPCPRRPRCRWPPCRC